MDKVKLFTRTGCGACMVAKRAMQARGLRFDEIDVDRSPAAEAQLRALGHLQLPVTVLHDGTSWAGFRPDLLEQVA